MPDYKPLNAQLWVNGHCFEMFTKNFSISYSIFSGTGQFRAEISPINPVKKFINENIDFTWPPEMIGIDKFEWVIGNKVLLSGYLDSWTISRSKDTHSLQITGRDMMSILKDNCFLRPTSYPRKDNPNKKWTIQEIIADVFFNLPALTKIQFYGDNSKTLELPKTINEVKFNQQHLSPVVTWKISTSAKNLLRKTTPITELKISTGDSIFEFLSRCLNPLGLFMYCNPGTNQIIIHTFYESDNEFKNYNYAGENDENLVSFILAGEDAFWSATEVIEPNIIRSELSIDRSKIMTYIKIVGNSNSEVPILKVTENGSITYNFLEQHLINPNDNCLHRFKVISMNDVDFNSWKNIPDALAFNISLNQAKEAVSMRYTTAGFAPKNIPDQPYFLNRTADIYENGTQLSTFITDVEYVGSKEEGQTTTLTVMPKALLDSFYTGEFLKKEL